MSNPQPNQCLKIDVNEVDAMAADAFALKSLVLRVK